MTASRRGLSHPVVLGSGLALILLIGGGAFVADRAAGAAEPKTGAGASAADVRTLVRAASACPALTAARLAGQVMVASGFGDRPVPAMRAGGASGVAALTPDQWRRYAPSPDADPGDRAAGITALAHGMCQLIGQTRAMTIGEDPWAVALAAHRVGMDQVVAAGKIPDGARSYVDDVRRYAAWYTLQPAFATTATTPPPPAAGPVAPVPGPYLKMVVAAGRVCAEVPPARIAAQIMATSGFDPDHLGPAGEQGIAQYRPSVWKATVKPAAGRTPWDPAVAIPALGRTMCALVKDSGGQYGTALTAFTGGGSALTEVVTKTQAEYAKDTRLQVAGAPAATTGRSAAPSSAASASKPSPKKTTKKAAPDQPERDQPPVRSGTGDSDSYGPYFLLNYRTKMCADIGGYGAGTSGGPVTQFPCAKANEDNQEWSFVKRGTDDDGYALYWIRNTDDSRCVDPPGRSTAESSAVLSEFTCLDADNQHFRLEPRLTADGFQFYWLRNSGTGMCLDVPGAGTGGADVRLALVPCLTGDDHEWALVQKSEW